MQVPTQHFVKVNKLHRDFSGKVARVRCGGVAGTENSPSLLRRQRQVAAPSIRIAIACVLLAAAPTAPPCFCRRQ